VRGCLHGFMGLQAAEKRFQAVIPSRALARTVQGGARNLTLSIFKAMRGSSSSRSDRDSSESQVKRVFPQPDRR
jgi:hypothetical protein